MKVEIGDARVFTKTVSEADVYLFAGISGDFYAAHVDAAFMATSSYGQRIAHGALLVGFMSAASSSLISLVKDRGDETVPVSLGYDRIRFVRPVFFGDTITTTYEVTAVDRDRQRSTAKVTCTNQSGITVALAEHIMKWLAADART